MVSLAPEGTLLHLAQDVSRLRSITTRLSLRTQPRPSFTVLPFQSKKISVGRSKICVVKLRHGGSLVPTNPLGPARSVVFVGVPTSRPVNAVIAETVGDGLKWWERGGSPNMYDVHSTQEFVDALAAAGDKLVIVEFYATWCGSCRALFPKFCKLATEYSDINFLKVNFDENKPMCKSLNVKVLPFFHIYRGAEGRLDSFSCSLSKLQRLKDAITKHHDGPCEDCPPPEEMGAVLAALLEKKPADQSTTAASSE